MDSLTERLLEDSMDEAKAQPCSSCKGTGGWMKNGQWVECPDCAGK